jgi:hypothetical protein
MEITMKRLCLLSMILILLAAGSVIAQDVRYNFDKSASFANYKTYKWVALKGAAELDTLMDGQIKAAMDSQLALKGLRRVEGETADLFIGYQAAIAQEKQFTSYSSDWGYGPGWGRAGWYGGGGGMSTTTGQTSTIYVGQLAVDMYDATKQNLVWRGLVSKTLDAKAKPEKQQKNLNKALTKLFKNYPPQVK